MKEVEHNNPIKLKDQIDYIPGGVANRAVMQDQSGEAFLMAVDKGAEVKEHTADAFAVVHVLEGEVNFTVDGKNHVMKEGDSIVLDPEVKHALVPVTPFKVAVVKLNK